jgi:hypothetical protein
MPGIVDKVIINDNSIKGMNAAIDAEFETMRLLGAEIIKHGQLKTAEPIHDKLKQGCEEYDKAQLAFLACQRECIKEMAEVIDKHVVK